MNDRIQELAEQAGLKYYNWSTNESNINDGNFKYPRLEDYNKFAELIVRECLNNMQNCDGDLDFAIWKTKKDFGVEE